MVEPKDSERCEVKMNCSEGVLLSVRAIGQQSSPEDYDISLLLSFPGIGSGRGPLGLRGGGGLDGEINAGSRQYEFRAL